MILRRAQVISALGLVSLATVLFTRPQLHLYKETELSSSSSLHCATGVNATKREEQGSTVSSVESIDWFGDNTLWHDSCLRVEHLCYSTGRRWYNSNSHNVTNVTKQRRRYHQPNFTLSVHKNPRNNIYGIPPKLSIHHEPPYVQNMTCYYSPTPNHLVLYALYDDMLGEFFSRLLVGLVYILAQQQPPQGDKENPQLQRNTSYDLWDDLLASTQAYLHLYNFDKGLLESHHAFMAPFMSQQLLNFQTLFQSTTCTCVERLILCGYVIKEEGNEISVSPGPGFPSGAYRGKNAPKDDPAIFRAARNFVRQRVMLNNPFVQEDTDQTRQKYLQGRGVNESSYADWKIVGLTQRTGRRKWLNLQESLKMCEDKLKAEKILCIEINVEDPSFTPTGHVVVHGMLDALIGIHGAQLTDALWMKPGSLVVEILPYLPRSITYGRWTRSVETPTPLGVLYMGTDLYHVGLPLDWRSVPQCSHKRGGAFTECVRRPPWHTRDFDVPVDDVHDVIWNFVGGHRPDDCATQRQRPGEDRFVLYNALCEDDENGGGNGVSHHYFYWKQKLETYDKYSSVPEEEVEPGQREHESGKKRE